MLKKLSALRGFAALYVFLHHFIGFTEIREQISPLVRFPFRFGQEAVILFFFISGFVIHYATTSKNHNFSQYIGKRIIRIYPIFICSMLISIIVFYLNGYTFSFQDLKVFMGNLLMLQDLSNKPGLWVNVFLENHALWSLSYEFIFYLLYFPMVKYFKTSRMSLVLVLGISIMGWISYLLVPNHLSLVLSYLIIWWTGVECAIIFIEFKDFPIKKLAPLFISLIVLTALTFIPIVREIQNDNFNFNPIMYPVVTARHFGFATIILFLGWMWWRLKLIGFNSIFSIFEKISPISYGLYVIHFPIIWLHFPSELHWIFVLIIKIGLIFFLSYLTELKLQPLVNKYLKQYKK